MAGTGRDAGLQVAIDHLVGVGAVLAYGPGPRGMRVTLAAWAEDAAGDLVARFGDAVDLTVGFLHFPDRTREGPGGWADEPPGARGDLLPPDLLTVGTTHPLTVRSGHTVTDRLVVGNPGTDDIVVATNGRVTARVLDPASGRVVGGSAGAQTMALVTFRVGPGRERAVPLVVGTASVVPDLGYAVPPGRWHVEVPVDLANRGSYRTPPLPLTVEP